MLKQSLAGAPAPWFVTGLGTIVALLTTFGHLSPVQTAVVYSLATAAGTIITAVRTRPVAVATLSGAAVTVLGDMAIVGFPHLSADQKGAVVGVLTFVLGAFLHLIHVPVTDSVKAPEPPPSYPPATP